MNKNDFARERLYQTTMAIARTMLKRNLLTMDEFYKLDKMMLEKYRPLLGGLSANCLIPLGTNAKN